MSKVNTAGTQNKPSKDTATSTEPEFKIGTEHTMSFPVNDSNPFVVRQRGSFGSEQVPNLHIADPETTELVVDPRMVTKEAPFPSALVGSILSGMKGTGN
jgi:hypothetical protein